MKSWSKKDSYREGGFPWLDLRFIQRNWGLKNELYEIELKINKRENDSNIFMCMLDKWIIDHDGNPLK